MLKHVALLMAVVFFVMPSGAYAVGIDHWQHCQFQINWTGGTPIDSTTTFNADLTYFTVPNDDVKPLYFAYVGPQWNRGSLWLSPKVGYTGGWFADRDGFIGAIWAGADGTSFAASVDEEVLYSSGGVHDLYGYHAVDVKQGRFRAGLQFEHVDLDYKIGPHYGVATDHWKVEVRVFRTNDGENILRLVTAIF